MPSIVSSHFAGCQSIIQVVNSNKPILKWHTLNEDKSFKDQAEGGYIVKISNESRKVLICYSKQEENCSKCVETKCPFNTSKERSS